MRQITNGARIGAVALALVGALAACSDDDGTTAAADDVAQPSATPPVECPAVAFHHDHLKPGCWAIASRGLPDLPRAELRVPAGFSGNDAWVWSNADIEDRWGAITVVPVGDVYRDPCTHAGNPRKVGPSVTDFARALAAQKVTTTTEPVPVSVGGYDGIYLEVSVPPDVDLSRCPDEELSSWETEGEPAGGPAPGNVQRTWVLDVEGQRMVLILTTMDDASHKTVRTFARIIEGATFATG